MITFIYYDANSWMFLIKNMSGLNENLLYINKIVTLNINLIEMQHELKVQTHTHRKLPFSCSHSSTGLVYLKGIFLLAIW